MAQYLDHADSSARIFGGVYTDYVRIHEWLDETKRFVPSWQHRALRHHSLGIQEALLRFGRSITNSDGKRVSVQLICEQHIKEDCGGIVPTPQDWLRELPMTSFALPRKGGIRLEVQKDGSLAQAEQETIE